jgi:hypothetical protein
VTRAVGSLRSAWRPSLSPAGLVLSALLVAASVAAAQALVSPELRSEATRLLRELASLRGIPSPSPPPPLVIQTREERRRFVVTELARKYSPMRLEAERRALVAWGLVPSDFDLAGFLADLLAEQAAAYYEPHAKRMVLANWLTPELRREALAHELVHVLQDRLVDLDRFLEGVAGHSDEGLARQALVEGEAVALSHDLGLRRQGRDFAALTDVVELQRAIRASATGPVVGRAPTYVRNMLTFPYAGGLGFIHAFRQRRSWAQLSALYRDPPRSSAQILHPERYLDRREDPLPLALADFAPSLPAEARLVIEDELGEIGVVEVLRQVLGDAADASGWRGDRYVLWDSPPRVSLLVSVTAWDTSERAAGFARAYATVMTQKHALPARPPDAPLLTWSVGFTAFAIERRDRLVLLIEGAPSSALDTLRDAVWAKRMLY